MTDMNYNSRGLAPISPMPPRRPDVSPRTASEEKRVIPAVVTLVLAMAVNLLVLANVDLPVIRPVLGFWFILILPAYFIFTLSAWRGCSLPERLGYSAGTAILTLMLVGLATNEIYPLLGVQRPLDAAPVVITGDIVNISLYFLRTRYPARDRLWISFGEFSKEEFRLLVMAALTVVLAVLGANRLNNGASGHVTLIALALAGLTGIFAVRWLSVTRESVMLFVFYLVSLGLLLTTSLRGWYVTGHDIQQEYQVFQLTEAHGHWSMAMDPSAYYACLSITILPTELGRIINVDSPYVFKFFFQAIFAICPILAYGISRRYFNRGISTLAVAYFVGFPTFFTDMPFLNRQEIGLIFVAIGVLAATNVVWSWRRRQVALLIAGVGVEVSHYSTMYVFFGTLAIALVCSYVIRLFVKPTPSVATTAMDLRQLRRRPPSGLRSAITIGLVSSFVGVIFVWGTLATNTTGQVLNDGNGAITSGAISLSLFSGSQTSPVEAMQEFRAQSLQPKGSQQSLYLPTAAVSKAATPIVNQPLNPLTAVGNTANSVGIPVEVLNSFIRNFVAYGEQLFLGIGLLSLVLARRRGKHQVGRQFFCMCIGSIGMIAANTVLPSIAADYGSLRAFQQGLLFFAPVIVMGSMAVFQPIGKYRARIASCLLCLGVYLGTSTLISQILGGNQAELNLNNSGLYYELYYTTAQESAAVSWLGGQPNVLAYPIQTSYLQEKFMFTSPNDVNGKEVITDAYPTLLLRNSWVILALPTTGASATAFIFMSTTGDLAEYKYPVNILHEYKNVVYTNGTSVVFK